MLHIALALMGISALVVSILTISQKQIEILVHREIINFAEREAREIELWLDKRLDAARTLAQIMECYEKEDVPDRRNLYNTMLKGVTESTPDIVGVWVWWKSDAIDGNDALHADTPGTDPATGRFAPYWYHTPSGVMMTSLDDHDIQMSNNSVLIAMNSGQETLTEPYDYIINGEDHMLVSLIAPVWENGQVAAVVGIDTDLTVIQRRVAEIRPYPGSAVAMYSNGGIVCGHFDPDRIGKRMSETEGDIAGTFLPDLREALRNGQMFVFDNTISHSFTGADMPEKGDMTFVSVPFNARESDEPWALMIGVPETVIMEPVYRMLHVALIVSIITLIVIACAARFFARTISEPITSMMLIAESVSKVDVHAVNSDHISTILTKTAAKRQDEIGKLAASFLFMSKSIQTVIFNLDFITNAVWEGSLHQRMETADLEGNFLRIIEGVNTALDLFCSQLDSLPEAMALFNRERECLYHNRAMDVVLERHNLSGEALLLHILPGETDELLSAPLSAAVFDPESSAPPTLGVEARLPGTSGETSIYTARLIRKGTTPVCVLLLLTDITVLSKAKIDAETANRTKTEFLSRMSHELRTPLNAVMGMTNIAMGSSDLGKIRDCLKQAAIASKQLLSLINNILDFSKIEEGKIFIEKEEFSLASVLDFTISTMQERAEEHRISLQLDAQDIQNDILVSDSLRLNQILINLLSNAIKFSLTDGNVTLRVRETGRKGGVSTYLFEVIDRGIGLSKMQMAKLFRPFEQSDGSITRSYGGTGLGLVISRNLVELLGGTIGLKSSLGEGSTFQFTIVCPSHPAVGTQDSTLSGLLAADTPRRPSLNFSGKRCLVVDDIEINREIVLELLSDTGMSIDIATNGKDAVSCFSASSEGYYDVILMDMQMPVMDGCTAAQNIRALPRLDAKKVAIIAMTANILPDDVRNVIESGMNAHIGKPVDMDEMYETLVHTLKYL